MLASQGPRTLPGSAGVRLVCLHGEVRSLLSEHNSAHTAPELGPQLANQARRRYTQPFPKTQHNPPNVGPPVARIGLYLLKTMR